MESKTKSKLEQKQVEKLVKKHFSDEGTIRIAELADGMMNSAWLIQGSGSLKNGAVLKVGPLPEAELLTYEKDLTRTEIEVYKILSGSKLPIPGLLAYDTTRQDLPCDYFFMEQLEGQTWKDCEEKLSGEDRAGLMYELGCCNAAIHSVQGKWFGYIKEDKRFRFDTWGLAFAAMMQDILNDGKYRGYDLPYEEINKTVQKYQRELNEIKVPKLVDFDLWAGNVFVKEQGGYHISGVVDFERCFYGDIYADFTSAMSLFDDVDKEPEFRAGYEKISGGKLSVTENDRIRMNLYRLYMAVILFTEAYRFDKAYAKAVQEWALERIREICILL